MRTTIIFLISFSIFLQPKICKSEISRHESEIFLHDTTLNDLSFEFNENESSNELLPEKMSFMEKFLWSKEGLLRKIGIASPLTQQSRSREIQLRRTMLTIHQTAGLLTMGLMLTQTISGQLWLDGKFSTPKLHRTLGWFSVGGYSLTALISVFVPPPLVRRSEFSTITVHKTLAWLHFAGMVATPILGKLINQSSDYYRTARIHQISAYVTTAIYTTAMVVIFLFE